MKFFKIFFLILINWHSGISQRYVAYNDLPFLAKECNKTSLSIELLDTSTTLTEIIGSAFLVKKNEIYYAVTDYHVTTHFKKMNQILCIGLNIGMKKQYARILSTIDDK